MFEWFGLVSFCPHTKVAEFAAHLKRGRLMATRCAGCGALSFPPRADCTGCLSGEFTFVELSGRGTLVSYTRVEAAPAGFEAVAPYTLGVVDLDEGGRLIAWFGASIPAREITIGMALQVVPQLFDEIEPIKVHYTLERPGTTWGREAVA